MIKRGFIFFRRRYICSVIFTVSVLSVHRSVILPRIRKEDYDHLEAVGLDVPVEELHGIAAVELHICC